MKWTIISALLAMILSLIFCLKSLSQVDDSLNKESSNSSLLKDSPKTIEILFYTDLGFGCRQRKDFPKLSRDLSIYVFNDRSASIQRTNILRSWDDTAMYILDYGIITTEMGARFGVSKGGVLAIWSINGFMSYAKRERTFKQKHILYQREPSTGLVEYIDQETASRSLRPLESMFVYESFYGQVQSLNYLRFGISPGAERHLEGKLFVYSVNINFDLGWNFLLNSKGLDPIGILDKPTIYYYNAIRFFVGLTFKK